MIHTMRVDLRSVVYDPAASRKPDVNRVCCFEVTVQWEGNSGLQK